MPPTTSVTVTGAGMLWPGGSANAGSAAADSSAAMAMLVTHLSALVVRLHG